MKLKAFLSSAWALLLMLGLAFMSTSAQSAATVEGTWRTLNGAEITVQPCDKGYCGLLNYIVVPAAQQGLCRAMVKSEFATLMLDYNNIDKALQTRSLLGVEMVTLQPTNETNTYTARIYNAEDGQLYDVLVWILNGQTFRLGGGCIGSICAVTQDWAKVEPRELVPDFTCEGGL